MSVFSIPMPGQNGILVSKKERYEVLALDRKGGKCARGNRRPALQGIAGCDIHRKLIPPEIMNVVILHPHTARSTDTSFLFRFFHNEHFASRKRSATVFGDFSTAFPNSPCSILGAFFQIHQSIFTGSSFFPYDRNTHNDHDQQGNYTRYGPP